ncbi:DUF1592 domain-containing protein [Novosphingobium bradum]|uniref:DUF1592 domain-containing protein n=1 Tax=Novosphingobium bradum TaxID=1737444 RepID=A0ABV7IN99_9SPHN
MAPESIVALRRLTEAQYRNSIADIFGADIRINGRFEPIIRPVQELVATGASESSISAAGFEQYESMARDIAGQVLAKERRATFLPCADALPARVSPACAASFFSDLGRYVYRRPLTRAEVAFYVDLARRGAGPVGDGDAGLQLGLAAMLVAPEFLYRAEVVGRDGQGYDDYTRASRLSFLIWNSVPDQQLLDAAAQGRLRTTEGIRAEVDRMLASPRAEQGVRAFYDDFLQLDRLPDLSKDTVVYPRFTAGVANDFREQALRTIVDHVLVRDQPYLDLFSTPRTFLNRRLGLVYQVPVASSTGWEPHEFAASEERLGLLGQGAFLALFSHEGRSSPTLRGKAIREVLLCQPVPVPPANVDFSGFNDTRNAVLKTARQRLSHHVSDPACAACHKITDPLGLPLEGFDGIGGRRLEENGAPIDTSGLFEGKAFSGLSGLARAMAQSPAASECMARRAMEYATGLPADRLGESWTAAIQAAAEASQHRYRALIREIVLSPQFMSVPARSALSSAATVAVQGPSAKVLRR